MNTYTKSSETHTFEGSIHIDDLLNMYEKIRTIVILKFPEFKKVEPRFDISIGDEDSKDLTTQEVENSFSPDQILSSCSFILNLPTSSNQQDVTAISFNGDNRHSIHITAEGTNPKPVDELVNLIIYKINPYVSTMNKERQPPAMHEERKEYTISDKPAKPDVSLDVYEVPEIKSNLSDSAKERLEKDSHKNTKYILAGIIFVVLVIAIIMIMTFLK
jgi:hypothetical protein